ncbi:MAG TPA: hypothetical protein VLV83_26965 [Acidobacteriota bacterium]|nr:hypothetical protein [Acidobacteriota bacterium]
MALLLTDQEINDVLQSPEGEPLRLAQSVDSWFRRRTNRNWEQAALVDFEICHAGRHDRLWLPDAPIDSDSPVTVKWVLSREDDNTLTTQDVPAGRYMVDHKRGRLLWRYGCWPAGEYLLTATVGYSTEEIEGDSEPEHPDDLRLAKQLLKSVLAQWWALKDSGEIIQQSFQDDFRIVRQRLSDWDREILEMLTR